MSVEEFIESFVNIELMENGDVYGYYPFNLVAETTKEKLDFNSLHLGGDVFSCYSRFRHYVKSNALEVFMAVDFPACKDILHDFVCVFSMIDSKLSVRAIPYDVSTGEEFDVIEESIALDEIKKQFLSVIKR